REGTLCEVADGLLALPAPPAPGAPRLVIATGPRVWTRSGLRSRRPAWRWRLSGARASGNDRRWRRTRIAAREPAEDEEDTVRVSQSAARMLSKMIEHL
ncbi:MAG: hypothetical protein LC808_02615, partial [Actinobacteria bacterium]|nr:hypothetical protein [Actinomycetota bacterium]